MIKLSFSVSEADGVYTLNLFADINDVKDIFVQNFDLTFSYSDITVDSSKITSDFGIFFSNNIVNKLLVGAMDTGTSFSYTNYTDGLVPLFSFDFSPGDGVNDFDFVVNSASINDDFIDSFAIAYYTNDAPTGSITLTGTPKQGELLGYLSTIADADGVGEFSYQWYADDVKIDGATSSTFTLTQSEVGKEVKLLVNYTDLLGFSESVSSALTSKIENINDTPSGIVSISGVSSENQILTASNSLADADGLGDISYQWLRDGENIGATGATYTLVDADVGSLITVKASYTDLQGTLESVTSSATTEIINVNDSPTGSISLSGNLRSGEILSVTSSVGDEDGLGDFTYTWYADDVVIDGVTGSSYQLTDNEIGSQIYVRVSYKDGHGTTETVTTALSDVIQNAGMEINGLVYHWKSHTLIEGVSVTASDDVSSDSILSDVQGEYLLSTSIDTGSLSVTKDVVIGDTKNIITSADALAALKIAVSVNPNADPDGAGELLPPEVSPYQFIAADVNKDGRVTSADALSILKMAVGLPAGFDVSWNFVQESENFIDDASGLFVSNRNSVKWNSDDLELAAIGSSSQNYVAVLLGDVNGSWNSSEMPNMLDDSYFQDLISKGIGALDQWGVVIA